MQAELLLSLGEPKKANGVLLDLVREHEEDAYSFQLLAESSNRLNQKQNAHYYLAKSLYIRGDRDGALQQLAVGLKLPDATVYQRERMLALQKVLRAEGEIAEREKTEEKRKGPRS
jgi:predicted Zn-dependent protease